MIKNKLKGNILLTVLIFGAIAATVLTGLASWGVTMLKSIRTVAQREQAFQIAEAGADYYQWHLAQYPNDYKDGTATSGPYVHNFFDKDGNILGTYSLVVTPPLSGSTVVKIESTGKLASSTISKKIRKTLAIPSLAKFAVVANDSLRFGEGTEVFGPIHSNGGIRFDGIAHNLITSAMATYTDSV
jgi:type II secretory pathway pseudopilin PulG